jgi:hypothetical protein
VPNLDPVFYWTGAAIAIAACVVAASLCLIAAAYLLKLACNRWWSRTLTIYRLESIRYYFKVMVDNGRTGLLKEVKKSEKERVGGDS